MKKSVLFRNCSVLFTAFALLCLSSCAGLLQKTGSVSFEIDKTLINAARNGGGDGPGMNIEVSIEGNGYGAKQTIFVPMEDYEDCLATDKKFEANFDNVPAGKTYYAFIKIFRMKNEGATVIEMTEPQLIGKSKPFKVKAGENIVDMKAFNYRCEFEFSLTIGFKEGTNMQEIQNNLLIDVLPTETTAAKKLLSAGDDDYKIYDILYPNDLPSTFQFYKSLASPDITFTLDGYNLIVNAKLSLPVDENTYGVFGKEIIFVARTYEYDEDFSFIPCIYGKSVKVIPDKKSTVNLTFEADKLHVLNTPLLTYNAGNNSRSYKIGEQTINVENYDFFTCFDGNGNFISVSKTDWSSESIYDYKIISSDRNEEITVVDVPYIFTGVTCDLVTNKVYMYRISTAEPLRLWDITEIKNTGIATTEFDDTTITIEYENVAKKNLIDPYHVYDLNGIVINNGVLYDFVYSNELPPCLVITNTIPDGQTELTLTPDKIVNFDIGGISSMEFCKITDMVFVNNALYVLFNYDEDTVSGNCCTNDNAQINSRGVLVKYDTKTQNIKKLGWTNSALNNTGTSISLIKYNYDFSNPTNSILYINHPGNNNVLKMTPDPNKITDYGYTFAAIYPKFYTPQSVDSYCFYGPEKIIAIKPKKLVIADDGRAFYTDNLGTYKYKNVNRIVTVDLESFSITNIKNADCTFDTEYDKDLMSSHYLSTDVITSQYSSIWDGSPQQYYEPIDTRLYIPLEDN